MKKKTTYRIRNWRDYNQSLVNRGSLTFWIDARQVTALSGGGDCGDGLYFPFLFH